MAPKVMEQLHGYDFKRYLVFWHYCFRACPWPCSFFKVSSMKVLLLTLQNAPLSLDYERDKKFSKMQMTSNNKFIRCDGREMNLFTHSQLMFTP
ncbi:Serine/threonine-protein kinase OSR1 [Camellia lanceoleosa]|uniref:Serine/threonine-protein kinase OSR1 n=1 Tax=Camellia lanceoleosa TaxID=1840588 RepID=A0ACC0GFS3_9ERIC|nr:Serine/threonine-protein kinase OSR1 [Camellia lanceoleosa]